MRLFWRHRVIVFCLAIIVLYIPVFIFLTHSSIHLGRTKKRIVIGLPHKPLNGFSLSYGTCLHLEASDTDFNTADIYPSLISRITRPNFYQKRDFWDSSMEKRHNDYKTDKSRPYLKVIVLPHSHNDPGWLKTYEQYYSQTTRFTLDNIATKLTQYRNMTFIWTEIASFSQWWQNALPSQRKEILTLVNEGRLEFTSGTWVMTDEATPHLYSMLDQMIEGHQWLKTHLNVTPKSAWSVDPYGHGPVAPYLLHAAGLKNTVVQRLHYGWKHWMADRQVSDFYWKMGWKSNTSMLCHNFLYDSYAVKYSCGPDPKVCVSYDFRQVKGEDNEYTTNTEPITSENIQKKAEVLLEQYAKIGSVTPHNVALILLGNHFRFDNEIEWDQQYSNYQSLFNYINDRKNVYNTDIGFGTLSDYFSVIRDRSGDKFPTLTGDFFPYADTFNGVAPAYWTGYYTSRPHYKMLGRELEDRLRGAEILYTVALNQARQSGWTSALTYLTNEYATLIQARRWLALFQHHDATTGTSRGTVMKDYGLKLHQGLEHAASLASRSASILLSADDQNWQRVQLLPLLRRPSYDKLPQRVPLDLDASPSQTIVVYNSEAHSRNEVVRLKISWPYVRVFDPNGEQILHQVNPVFTNDRKLDPVNFELVFVAQKLAPLSLTSYRMEKITAADAPSENMAVIYSPWDLFYGPFQWKKLDEVEKPPMFGPFRSSNRQEDTFYIENQKIMLSFDARTGFLKSIFPSIDSRTTPCRMQFAAYPSTSSNEYRSGAYLFKIDADQPEIDVLKNIGLRQLVVIEGPVMSEVSVIYNRLLAFSTTIYHDEELYHVIQVESTMDMGPGSNYQDHEFFLRFHTDIENVDPLTSGSEFYTDQNGFAFARRVHLNELGVEGNYYPVTSAAFIQDDYKRLNLLVNSAKGFTSRIPGVMELMLDRRTTRDDGRGLSEGMTDNLPISTSFILLLEHRFDNKCAPSKLHSMGLSATRFSTMLSYPASIFVIESDQGGNVIDSLLQVRMLFVNQTLPLNVHLVGIRTLSETSSLVSDLPSKNALMTFHNRAIDFSALVRGQYHVKGEEDDRIFHPQTSIIGLKVDKMDKTSLTGLESFGRVDFDSARLAPMELCSFNVTFS